MTGNHARLNMGIDTRQNFDVALLPLPQYGQGRALAKYLAVAGDGHVQQGPLFLGELGKRHVDDRALVGHQCGQCHDLVLVDVEKADLASLLKMPVQIGHQGIAGPGYR